MTQPAGLFARATSSIIVRHMLAAGSGYLGWYVADRYTDSTVKRVLGAAVGVSAARVTMAYVHRDEWLPLWNAYVESSRWRNRIQ